jgi:polyisoprenoid-binding protein YceI
MTASQNVWILDQTQSTIGFNVKHLMFSKVLGSFKKFSGKIEFDSKGGPPPRIEGEIEVSSVQTGDESRDEYLRTSEFFEIKKYPKITFLSSAIKFKAKNEFELVGALTLHGLTREVVIQGTGIPSEWNEGMKQLTISAKTRIRRKDFGLEWGGALEAGGVLVGDEISISLELKFTRGV